MELHVQPPASSADELYDPTNGAPPAPPSPPPPPFASPVNVPLAAAAADGPRGKENEEAKPGTPETAAEAKSTRAKKRRRRRALKVDAPAWAVSVGVHVAVLLFLGLATFSSEVKQMVVPHQLGAGGQPHRGRGDGAYLR